MKKNLLSVPQITDTGRYVLFGPKEVMIFDEFETKSKSVVGGKKNESVYVLSAGTAFVGKVKTNNSADLWHQRLSHVGYDKLKLMMTKQFAIGLPNLDVNLDVVCSGCQYGKAHELPYGSSQHRSTAPLELVHTDVFGAVKQSLIEGKRYMITFIDDFSRYFWTNFMKEKSEA
ncbi:putative mitochondrial protein AtMg00300 [Bidens hawaiensis]|uniref:putative mitochondrial protein AtMg00300 n=1 Tax=Bidens hawaiensis TaxID=980011 RepID=UPI0040498E6D